MATVTGAMTTTNVLSNQLSIDIGKRISLLEPDVQILTVLTRELGKEDTSATKFKWVEDEAKARFDTVAAATVSSSATTAEVSHGTYFQGWDQVLNTRTGEQVRVDSVTGNVLTITRGIGSTAAEMLQGDELQLIGTAQPENDTSKSARAKTPSVVENYTQIFRTPFEISDTAKNVGYMVSPREWERLSQNAAIEHAKDIELSFLFGRKSATNPGASEDRTTGGALSFITSNQTDAGGTLSEVEWNSALQQAFRYGGNNKIAIASATVVSALNKFPASKQIVNSGETTYGMNVTTYSGPFGSVRLVYHRLLEGSKYGGYGLILDLDEIKYRSIANRDTHLRTEIQPPDQDGHKAEFLSECGLQFGMQRRHAVLSGVTG